MSVDLAKFELLLEVFQRLLVVVLQMQAVLLGLDWALGLLESRRSRHQRKLVLQ